MASRSNKFGLFTLGFMLLCLSGWAQTFPLQIQVNVMPPYSAYLQDYPGTGQQVRVFIINTSRTTYQIRLSGQLTGDNGIEIKTSPNYRPPRPVTVPPGQTLLTRNDLEGLFDLNQIDVTGIDRNLLARGLPLPDGTYQLCVRAFNETATNTAAVAFGQPLSAEFPIGCSSPIIVRSVDPPILIAPLCDAEVITTIPQALVFTWTPPAGVSPASVEYTLRVVELPHENVDPNVFIDAIALPRSGVEVRNLRTSTFLYGPTQPPLVVGKRYAWRVQAIDRSRRLVFQNDGKSPVCAFTYGPANLVKMDSMSVAPASIGNLVFTSPNNCSKPSANTVKAGTDNDLRISWQMDKELRETFAKAFNIASGNATGNLLTALKSSDIAYQFTISQNSKTLVLRTQKEPTYTLPVTKEFPLKFGSVYNISVELVGMTDLQRKALGLTKGAKILRTCSFKLIREDKKIPNETTIAGTLNFRYPGDTKIYPLTNTRVRVQYVPTKSAAEVQSKVNADGPVAASSTPKLPVKPVNKPGTGNGNTSNGNGAEPFTGPTVALGATVLTDEQGKYTLKVEDYLKLLGVDTSASTPPPGYLKVVVESPYVEQPTDQLMISLQKQISLPDQLVLARSYNLTINARKTFDKKNWPGLSDKALDGQLVVIYRKPDPTKGLSHLPPVEGMAERFLQFGAVQAPDNLTGQMGDKASGVLSAGQSIPKGAGGSTTSEPSSSTETTTFFPLYINEPDPIYGAMAAMITTEEEAKAELKKAKLAYVAAGTLKVINNQATVLIGRMLYTAGPNDKYYAYCPNMGQTVGGAIPFSFKAQSDWKMDAVKPRSETLDLEISTNQPPHAQFSGRLLYRFADPEEAGKVKPLANTRVRLVVSYVIGGGKISNKDVSGFHIISGTELKQEYTDNLKTLATTTTDNLGNFSFSAALDKPYKLGLIEEQYESKTGPVEFPENTKGPLYRTFRVVVDNPYYASPAYDFGTDFLGTIKPFSTNPLGDLTAVAQSYKLTVKAVSTLDQNQNAGSGQELTGVDVYILRPEKPVSKGSTNMIPPIEEGQNLGKTLTTGNGKTYWIVAKGRTADKGLVTFTKLIREDGVPNIDDYIMAGISNITSLNSTQDKIADLTNDAPVEPMTNVIDLTTGTKPYPLQPIPTFANDYYYGAYSCRKQFKPGLPRITVRAVDAINPQQGLSGARVKLKYILDGKEIKEGYTVGLTTDSAGYFTWQLDWASAQLMQNSKAKAITGVTLHVGGLYGYFHQDSLGKQSSYATYNLKTMLMGANYYNEKVLLQPDGILTGRLVLEGDGSKTGVKGQVQAGLNGPIVETDNSGSFVVQAPSGLDSLRIYPNNKIYFEERVLPKPFSKINNSQYRISTDNNVTIYERDHRIKFRVLRFPIPPFVPGLMSMAQYTTTILGPALVPGVTVTVFGEEFTPAGDGYINVKFKNASLSNLSMTVSAKGFISQTIALPKNEESRDFKTIKDVVLKMAKAITGTVALYKNGAPATTSTGSQTASGTIKLPGGVAGGISGAELYVLEGKGAGSLTAVSGPGGMFTLYVPEDLEKATVRVAYADKTNTTYEGMTAQAEPGKPLNLTVTVFDKFSVKTIYGFPVKLTDITEKGKNTTVSGEVILSQDVFRPIDPTVKLTFKDVAVKANDLGGADPVDGLLPLGIQTLQTGYYGGGGSQKIPDYNVRLEGVSFKGISTLGTTTQLAVTPREGSTTGWIRAKAQVVDNSFKFPSSLLSYEKGQFHLFDPSDSKQKEGVEPIITAFVPSGHSGVIRYPYGLCRADGSALQFSFLQFPAVSKPEKSRLVGGEIWIGPDIQCSIPNAQPANFTVSVDKIVLKNNTIDPQTGKEPIIVPLGGKWKLNVPNWTLDYKEGGFYAKNSGKLVTGKVDLPLKTFNLRNNLFVKEVDTENLKTVSLADVTTLNIGGKAYFDYDTRTGSDQAGHWTVVFAPSQPGGTAASISKANLTGLTNDLVFETFSLLDNGEDILSFAPSVKAVKLYNLVDFVPRSIETGSNYFAIGGSMSTQIPRVQKDMSAQMRYSKPNGTVALNLTMPTPIQFEAPGYVQFKNTLDQKNMPDIQLKENLMVLRGTVEEPGELEPLKTLLVHTPTATRLIHDVKYNSLNDLSNPATLPGSLAAVPQKIPITGDARYFDKVTLQMDVKGKDWDLLKFTGVVAGTPGIKPDPLTFTVHGEIVANDQKVGVEGVNVGGASFSLVYDRKKSHLTGTAILPGFPMDGGMSFEGGAAQFRLGTPGFYMATSGQVNDVPVIIPITVKAGMIVGYYDSRDFGDAEPIVFMFTHQKQFPCAFTDNFKGYFMIGEVPIPVLGDFHKKYNFGLGSAEIGIDAYVDSYFYGKYQGITAASLGGGTSISARAWAQASALGGLLKVGGEVSMAGTNQNEGAIEGTKLTLNYKAQTTAGLSAWGSLYNPFGDDFKEDFSISCCLTMGCSLTIPNFLKPYKLPKINPDIDFSLNSCPSGCK